MESGQSGSPWHEGAITRPVSNVRETAWPISDDSSSHTSKAP